MDTQNVSAQLYFKQLPLDNAAGSYNCTNIPSGLSTCVDPVSSDREIETAFQQQLDLSEYYKSPQVFDAVKRQYMDQTMENKNTPTPLVRRRNNPPKVPLKLPVGPTDFLRNYIKEGFGGASRIYIILLIVGLIGCVLAYSFNLI
jgi:hypothetical protein